MKRLLIAILVLLPFAVRAQQVVPPGYVLVDSLIFTPLAAVDSTLEGSTIFNVLPEGVNVRQSGIIRNAVETRIRANRGKMVSGYRIRIFFDNEYPDFTWVGTIDYKEKGLHMGFHWK